MTRAGNFKLMHGRFGYTRAECHKDVTYWRCSKAKSGKCRAKAHTRNFGEKHLVKIIGTHNHSQDNFESES